MIHSLLLCEENEMKKSTMIMEHKVDGEYMIVPIVDCTVKMDRVCCLSNTAAFIWELLDVNQDTDIDTIVSKVSQKYGVCSDDIYNDIKEFVDSLLKNGIIV